MTDQEKDISNPFSAADAATGYLYQIRVALLWSLQRLRSGSDFTVSLETLDDVAFETKGNPTDLLQTKHHRTREAALTDASVDLWKSLRVWFEGRANQSIPSSATLYLITTSTAPESSAPSKLRRLNRNVSAALSALTTVAQTSTNQTNLAAYKIFLSASAAERLAILEQITVVDGSAQITDLDKSLRDEIFWASDRKYHDPFLERVEGWWFRRSLKQLTSSSDRILSDELEAEMSDLREQFKLDSLPIDGDLLDFTLDDATYEAHSDTTFVRQLEIIKAGKRRIAAAVRDYYRAFTQRSRWTRDNLLLVGELEKYQKRLVEEWEIVFEAMKDELGADVADNAKERAAREVLKWAERISIPIRPGVTEPFVTRGSLHMLADDMKVGWHPEFENHLASVLGLTKQESK